MQQNIENSTSTQDMIDEGHRNTEKKHGRVIMHTGTSGIVAGFIAFMIGLGGAYSEGNPLEEGSGSEPAHWTDWLAFVGAMMILTGVGTIIVGSYLNTERARLVQFYGEDTGRGVWCAEASGTTYGLCLLVGALAVGDFFSGYRNDASVRGCEWTLKLCLAAMSVGAIVGADRSYQERTQAEQRRNAMAWRPVEVVPQGLVHRGNVVGCEPH